MSTSREIGRWGEDYVARVLERRGYTITARNWSCRFGEIDIIAENNDSLAFVEVKLRKNDRYGAPREYVTWSKQRKLILAAELWLGDHPTEKQPRFDVAELYGSNGVIREMNYLEDAFTVS